MVRRAYLAATCLGLVLVPAAAGAAAQSPKVHLAKKACCRPVPVQTRPPVKPVTGGSGPLSLEWTITAPLRP